MLLYRSEICIFISNGYIHIQKKTAIHSMESMVSHSEAVTDVKKNYWLAKYRLPVSRVLGVLLLCLLLITAPKLVNPLCTIPLDIVGFLLLVVGAMGRIWCSVYISGLKSRTVVSKGPFSMTRNPLYFFSLIGVVGIGLSTYSITVLIIFLILYKLIYGSTISSEESVLEGLFGEQYLNYKKATPRLWPKFSLLSREGFSNIDLKAFEKSILDVSLFFVAYGFIKLVMLLHVLDFIPTVFFIY